MNPVIDRRDFLRTSTAIGSTIGVLAATGMAQARVNANDIISIAVIGANGQGLKHLSYFGQQPGVEISYICDVDERIFPKAMALVAEGQKQKPKQVRDFRKVLDDPSVDAVSIATPNHWHAPLTILACAAGKHVYVEKPCSHTAEEGELAIRAARKYDRIVQMGNQRRSRADYIEAIGKIHAGVIGKVHLARTWYNNRRETIGVGRHVPVPRELDYSLWQGPAPERPYVDNLLHYNWHWRWHWGGGELANNGIHALDVARWGMNVTFPTRITSSGAKVRFDDDQETPDTQYVTYEFDKKIITWEGLSWSPYGPGGSRFGISFHGEEGTMNLHDMGYTIFDRQNNEVETITQSGSDSDHYANFVSAIRNKAKPLSDIELAHQSSLLCHLGNISYRVQRTIKTDSQNGHIINDSEAQQLWRREYRKGWEPEGAS